MLLIQHYLTRRIFMNQPFLQLLAASFLGLTTVMNPTYAQGLDNLGAKYAEVTTYFDYGVRSPAEVDLFYDNKHLSNISLYGSTVYKIVWLVDNDRFSCESFEEKIPHLVVKKNGVILSGAHYSCTPYEQRD
jgi:hypothetical protein